MVERVIMVVKEFRLIYWAKFGGKAILGKTTVKN